MRKIPRILVHAALGFLEYALVCVVGLNIYLSFRLDNQFWDQFPPLRDEVASIVSTWTLYDGELHGYFPEINWEIQQGYVSEDKHLEYIYVKEYIVMCNELSEIEYNTYGFVESDECAKFGTRRIVYSGVNNRFQEALLVLNPFRWNDYTDEIVNWHMDDSGNITIVGAQEREEYGVVKFGSSLSNQ
jgi:hypothetical protein